MRRKGTWILQVVFLIIYLILRNFQASCQKYEGKEKVAELLTLN